MIWVKVSMKQKMTNDKFHEEQDEKYPYFPSPVDMEEGDEQDDNTERLDEKKESKRPGITRTIYMEEGMDDDEDDSTERLDEEKETKVPNDNPPIDMEESVHDKKYDNTERLDGVKEAKCLD